MGEAFLWCVSCAWHGRVGPGEGQQPHHLRALAAETDNAVHIARQGTDQASLPIFDEPQCEGRVASAGVAFDKLHARIDVLAYDGAPRPYGRSQ